MQRDTHAARRALAETIRAERKQRGYRSQEAFAEACGLHRNAIGMIERAEVMPTFDNLLAIAAALGLRPSELLARARL